MNTVIVAELPEREQSKRSNVMCSLKNNKDWPLKFLTINLDYDNIQLLGEAIKQQKGENNDNYHRTENSI